MSRTSPSFPLVSDCILQFQHCHLLFPLYLGFQFKNLNDSSIRTHLVYIFHFRRQGIPSIFCCQITTVLDNIYRTKFANLFCQGSIGQIKFIGSTLVVTFITHRILILISFCEVTLNLAESPLSSHKSEKQK